MSTPILRRGLRTGFAVLALSAVTMAFAPLALAQSGSEGDADQSQNDGGRPPRPQLTDEQRACLEQAGVEKPAEGERPTEEQRAALRAAAEQCGIPFHRHHPRLTDEQKTCLQEAGVEKPAAGERPTEEQRDAFRAAAEQCGIDLPQRPGDGDGGGSQGNTENQSTAV